MLLVGKDCMILLSHHLFCKIYSRNPGFEMENFSEKRCRGVRKEEEDLKPPWLRQLYKTIINVNGIYLLWSGSYKTDSPCFFPLESTRGMMLITKIKSPPVL